MTSMREKCVTQSQKAAIAVAATFAVSTFGGVVQAANTTWTWKNGTGTPGSMTAPSNWTLTAGSGSNTYPNASGDIAQFLANVGAPVNLYSRGSQTIGEIIFQNNFNASNTTTLGNDTTGGSTTLTLGTGMAAGATILDVQATSGVVTIQPKNVSTSAGTYNLNIALGSTNGVINVAQGGALNIASQFTSESTVGSTITKTGGGTLQLTSASAAAFTGGLTISGGTVEFTAPNALGSFSGAAGGVTFDGGTLKYTGTGTSTSRYFNTTANGGTFDNAAAFSLGGALTGTGKFTKTGNGTLTLTNTSTSANTLSGGFVVSGGAVSITSTASFGSSDVTIQNGATVQDATTSTSSLSTGRNWTVGSGGGVFELTNAGSDMTLSGNITGAGSFTKTGDGLLTLSGGSGNTFSGGIVIGGGTLSVLNTASLGSAAAGVTDVTIGNGATLRDTTGVSASSSKAFAIGAGGGTIEVSNPAGSLTISGAFSGSGNLSKAGAGALTLSKDGSTINGLNVTNGTMTVSGDTAFTGGITVGSGTTLTLTGTNTLSGGVTVNNGTFVFNSVNALGVAAGNTTTLNGGTMRYTSTGSGSTGRAFALSGAPTMDITTGKLTLGGTIGGSGGSLTKTGDGTLVLSGTQSYTGGTTVSAGTLLLNGTYSGGAVGVASNASLGGTGSATSVSNSGTLSAGTSGTVGTFALSDLSGTGTIGVDLDGAAAAGSQIDRINVSGALDLTGATINFNQLSAPVDGAYVFASYGSLTGTPTLLNVPTGYEVNFNYNSGSQIALTAVPEPAVLGLLAVGAVGLLRRRRRN